MSIPKDGGAAFPTQNGSRGMSLRDYFAGQALHAVIVSNLPMDEGSIWSPEFVAESVYVMADAVMKARETTSDGKHTQGG